MSGVLATHSDNTISNNILLCLCWACTWRGAPPSWPPRSCSASPGPDSPGAQSQAGRDKSQRESPHWSLTRILSSHWSKIGWSLTCNQGCFCTRAYKKFSFSFEIYILVFLYQGDLIVDCVLQSWCLSEDHLLCSLSPNVRGPDINKSF